MSAAEGQQIAVLLVGKELWVGKLQSFLSQVSKYQVFVEERKPEAIRALMNRGIDLLVVDQHSIEVLRYAAKQIVGVASTLVLEESTPRKVVVDAVNNYGVNSLLLATDLFEDESPNPDIFEVFKSATQEAKRAKVTNVLLDMSQEIQELSELDPENIRLVFAEFDERFGPKPIAIFPELPDGVDEVGFVNQVFFSFTSVYGDRWVGGGAKLTLPLVSMNASTRIYFDYLDADVRGGRIPRMFAIIMPSIPTFAEKIVDSMALPHFSGLLRVRYFQDLSSLLEDLESLQLGLVFKFKAVFSILG